MAPPKSILKKSSGSTSTRKAPVTTSSSRPAPTAGPCKPKSKAPITAKDGSKKPKQTVTLSQKKGKKVEKVKKAKKVEEDEDEEMEGDDESDNGDEEELGTDEEIERAQSKDGKKRPVVSKYLHYHLSLMLRIRR